MQSMRKNILPPKHRLPLMPNSRARLGRTQQRSRNRNLHPRSNTTHNLPAEQTIHSSNRKTQRKRKSPRMANRLQTLRNQSRHESKTRRDNITRRQPHIPIHSTPDVIYILTHMLVPKFWNTPEEQSSPFYTSFVTLYITFDVTKNEPTHL